MASAKPAFVGVELYFERLEEARHFYTEVLELAVSDEQPGHYVKFDSPAGFICLERKGAESYASFDKAVLFLEVEDLAATIAAVGPKLFVKVEPAWAVLHDPEGHNILLLQKGKSK